MSTAVADVSGLIEAASSPDPSPVSTVAEEPIVETQESETAPETTEGGEVQDKALDAKVDARTNPDAIRKVLKSLRDSSPENAPVARKLNDIVGRYEAMTKVFPKVADAQQAKFLLDSVGGSEGLSKIQSTIKSVNETDAMLYSGDARVLDSILEDMKAVGKQDAFGKLAGPYLDKLADIDPKAYTSVLRPHFFEGINKSGFPDMLSGFAEALGAKDAEGKPSPDLNQIKGLVAEMKRWYDTEKQAVEGHRKTATDPDRQAFEKEKSEFQTQKQKAFQNEVNQDWNRVNSQELGGALKPYLKLPFAKNWTDATKKSVAGEIMSTFLSELSKDKAYQSQMDAFWSESKPDKARILDFHKGKTKLIAANVVKTVLDARYPDFRSVKGPVPSADKPAPAAQASGKPVFQTNMPNNDEIDWKRDPERLLYITGRFYDKRGVFKTWNAKYR